MQQPKSSDLTLSALSVKDRKEALENYERNLSIINQLGPLYQCFLTALSILEEHDFEHTYYQSTAVIWINIKIPPTLTIKSFEPVLAAMMDKGYEVSSSSDYVKRKGGVRTFRYNFDLGDYRSAQMHFDLDILPENPVCRSVLKGTETKIVPIYELVCDDGAVSAPQTKALIDDETPF